jgi:hypothetical protein
MLSLKAFQASELATTRVLGYRPVAPRFYKLRCAMLMVLLRAFLAFLATLVATNICKLLAERVWNGLKIRWGE